MTLWRYFAVGLVMVSALQPSMAQPSQLVGSCFPYRAVKGDSLSRIGARFGVSVRSLAQINRVANDHRLQIGEELTICNQHLVPRILENGILINIPQRMLFLFQNGEIAASYPVAVGRAGWETPTGTFTVKTKVADPTWYVPRSIQEEMETAGQPIRQAVPPSTQNPLGKYWVGLDAAGFGLHGTNTPASIHQFQTHGCIRLLPEHVAELYDRISIGSPVVLIYEPVLIRQVQQTVYLEVHRDEYRRGHLGLKDLIVLADQLGIGEQVNWDLVRGEMKNSSGLARAVSHW